MSIETLVQVAEGLQTSADILIYGSTKDGRILHIVKMLESMPMMIWSLLKTTFF